MVNPSGKATRTSSSDLSDQVEPVVRKPRTATQRLGRTRTQRRMRVGAVLGVVMALVGVSFVMPTGVGAEGDIDTNDTPEPDEHILTLDQATIDWAFNDEANSASFAGNCHYLSAGETDGYAPTYRGTAGNVTVYKLQADDSYAVIHDYESRCNDKFGKPVNMIDSRRLGQKVHYSNGVGTVDTETGEVELEWEGTFSNVFYGYMVPTFIADPRISIDADGNGTLIADIGGYKSSIDNPDVREPVPLMQDVLVGTFSGAVSANEEGVVINFDYEGVEYDATAPQTPQNRIFEGWGSWPTPMVDAMVTLGLGDYFYSTGSPADARKRPDPMIIGYGPDSAPTAPTTTTTTTIPVTVPSVTMPTTSTTTTVTPQPTTTTLAPKTNGAPSSPASNAYHRGPQFHSNNQRSTQSWNTERSSSRRNSSMNNRGLDRNRSVGNSNRSGGFGNGRGLNESAAGASAAAMLSNLAPNHLGWSVNIANSSVRLSQDSTAPNTYVGSLPEITVQDTRNGSSSWVITGQISQDVDGLGRYFGWVPQIRSGGPGVIPGEVVNAGSSSRVLTDPSVLATSTGDQSGTVTIGADISLTLPNGKAVGDRPATLTITALG